MSDFIEIELTKRDGSKRYEMIARDNAASETWAMIRLHDAIASKPVAVINADGSVTHAESGLLKAAKDICFHMLNAGIENKIPPSVWDAMQDAIATEDHLNKKE